MTIKAGMDHTRYEQLIHPADRPDNKIGCHQGNSDNLNVYNPQPGFHYYHVLRTANAIATATRKGYTVVRAEDPEYTALVENDNFAAANIDSSMATGGLVLCRMPIETFRALEAAHEERSRSQADGAQTGDDYLRKDSLTGTDRAPRTSADRAVYFKRSEHGMTDVDQASGL